jgi:uncharacterized membrane protein
MTATTAPSTVSSYAAPAASATTIARARMDSVDLLRGIVMVIMMLDHTRDYVAAGTFQFDPTDLTRTTPAFFFTRWITHFCAPTFVFLAGASIYFQRARGMPVGELSKFLVKRGLWLIVLEFTVLKWLMWYNFNPGYLATLQVIWVIGISMIAMAALVHLPLRAVALFGIATIVLGNLLDPIQIQAWTGPESPVPSWPGKLWMLIHQAGPMPVAGFPGPMVLAMYTFVPWVGVMATGYGFGVIYEWEAERRRRFLVRVGLATIAAFFIVRAINVYGDPAPWKSQARAVMTVVSFFNVTKYPVSFQFLMMTLGPAMLLLAWLERVDVRGRLAGIFVTFGRVPLFYYLLQWVMAHTMGIVLALAAGKSSVAHYFKNPPDAYTTAPPDAGFSLGVTWIAWLVGVALLYPLCRWYAGVKGRHKESWLKYL